MPISRSSQALLDEVPAPLEPLDVSMLDGFLVAVILQPKPVPLSDWWRWVLDSEEGRPAPARYDARPLLQLVQRREHDLKQAIADRQWFDPWVFELDEDASASETVLPWVAGLRSRPICSSALMNLDETELTEPLAQLYMHLDPEDPRGRRCAARGDREPGAAGRARRRGREPRPRQSAAGRRLPAAARLKPQRPGGHRGGPGGPGGARRGGSPPRRLR